MPLFWTTLRLVLLEATKSRLPWLILFIALISIGISQFLGQLAILEAAGIQSAIQAAFLRLCGVFVIVTFVITSMVREADDKVTDLLLSQSPPRAAYFFGKLCGYSIVAMSIAVLFAAPPSLTSLGPGLLAWTISLSFELILMASLALFCALSLAQALPALSAAAAFYILGRSLTTIQLIATAPSMAPPSIADQVITWLVKIIALFLPRLDEFSQSAWMMSDSVPASLGGTLEQSLPFMALIIAASLFDLYRKNF
jgi:hypothetical protein